jgi:hypothetical protein
MKWINLFVLLNISILFVEGCQFQLLEIKEKQIEQKILTKIKQDNTEEIANLEASYSVNYVNFNKSWFGKNNFYIRNDVATVFYGYSLKDVDIKVVTENNRGVLRVKLSPPKQVGSMSRYIVPNEKHSELPNYIPLDEKGQKADVEKYIKERLDKTIKTYEEKAINSTRTMSELYFQNIADRFGLKLELEFSPTRVTGEEKTDDKTQNKS